MANKIFYMVAGLLLLITVESSAQTTFYAHEFGILPDDGIDDTQGIKAALNDPRLKQGGILKFEAGIYNLKDPVNSDNPLIYVNNLDGITIQGAVDHHGEPATIFERNMDAPNAKDKSSVIVSVRNCKNFSIKNIKFQNNPEFASAGIVKRVDRINDYVEVEVLDNLPHFDGMIPCSANAWDLSTKELLPVAALTIGTDASKFPVMHLVNSGASSRLYRVDGGKMAEKLKVGDGMSWHFYVTGGSTQLDIGTSENVLVENVRMSNSRLMSIGVRFSKNLTFKKVVLFPSCEQLAVGGRDAFHLICNTGRLLMEDCHIKGYRWDPMNIKSKIGRIEEVIDKRTVKATIIIGSVPRVKMAGDSVILFTGDTPDKVGFIESDTWSDGKITDLNGSERREVVIKFAQDLPESLSGGDAFSPYSWLFDEAIIRRCVFDGNFGRSILYQGANLLVEDCEFRNNAYANIALGPINVGEGSFARNIRIINNVFSNSTWLSTTSGVRNGTIKIYERFDPKKEKYNYNGEPYNYNILIENNSFSGINFTDNFSAINIENATGVVVRNNIFEDNKTNIYVDEETTKNIYY